MDLRELRIGNYVNISGKPYRVESLEYDFQDEHRRELYIEGNYDYNYAIYADPIPITEEWLLKFGFGGGVKAPSRLSLETEFGKTLIDFNDLPKQCQYIHQLQNLYFVLTGKELEIHVPATTPLP